MACWPIRYFPAMCAVDLHARNPLFELGKIRAGRLRSRCLVRINLQNDTQHVNINRVDNRFWPTFFVLSFPNHWRRNEKPPPVQGRGLKEAWLVEDGGEPRHNSMWYLYTVGRAKLQPHSESPKGKRRGLPGVNEIVRTRLGAGIRPSWKGDRRLGRSVTWHRG